MRAFVIVRPCVENEEGVNILGDHKVIAVCLKKVALDEHMQKLKAAAASMNLRLNCTYLEVELYE